MTQPWLVLPYMTCAVLLPAVSLHFYQLFPRPKPWFQARPVLTIAVTYSTSTAFLLALMVLYGIARTLARTGARAADQQVALDWMGGVVVAYFVASAHLYLASVLCLAHSYRRARDVVVKSLLGEQPLPLMGGRAPWACEEV